MPASRNLNAGSPWVCLQAYRDSTEVPVPSQGCLSPSLCEGILCLALPKAQEGSPGHLWVAAEASPRRTSPQGPQLCAGLSSQAETARGEITASLVSVDLPPGIPQKFSKLPSPADSHPKPCLYPPLPQDELSPEGDPQPVLAVGTSRPPGTPNPGTPTHCWPLGALTTGR